MKILGAACVLWAMGLFAGPAHAQAVEYLHTDALGSIVAVTNSAGQVIERREYEPYGRQLKPTPLKDGPGYTGHVSDAATGLDYMQQRYYDPGIGRFLSVDPVTADGNTGGNFNRYKYAASNPYRFTDPDGRQERAAEQFNDAYAQDPGAFEAFEPVAIAITTAMVALTPVVGPPLATGLRVAAREGAQEAAKESKAPLMGRNPKDGGSRTNTDAGAGGNRATAKSVFRNQAEGKKTTTPMSNGGTRTRADNRVQVRHNPDGSSRVDMPNRGSTQNGESLHTPPPPPPPPPPLPRL